MTVLGSRYMVYRRIFANGVDAIVTTRAVVSNAGMIKHAGGKAAGVMADTAILGGGDVCGWLANGGGAVVA